MNTLRRASALLLPLGLLWASTAPAQTAAAPAKVGRETAHYELPQGPVTITADRAEFEQSGVMLYRGRVKLVSGPLELTGDRLELQQPSKGVYLAKITGAPAHLYHGGDDPATPPINANAGEISYSSQAGTVELKKDVQLDRSGDLLTGQAMRYDLAARRISAEGAEGGQVRIVMQPPPGTKLPEGKKISPPRAGRESDKP